jgi:hypothetical protein
MRVPRWPHSVSFVTQLINWSPLVLRPKLRNRRGDFDAQIIKLELSVLRPKLGNSSHRFWGQTERSYPNGFEVKVRNMHSSSPCAWYRLHTASPDLSIVWPPSTRPVLDHPWSSISGLLLLPRSSSLSIISHLSHTHHETSKHDSPHGQR